MESEHSYHGYLANYPYSEKFKGKYVIHGDRQRQRTFAWLRGKSKPCAWTCGGDCVKRVSLELKFKTFY